MLYPLSYGRPTVSGRGKCIGCSLPRENRPERTLEAREDGDHLQSRRDFVRNVCAVADGIRRRASGQVVVTVAKAPGPARIGGRSSEGWLCPEHGSRLTVGRRSHTREGTLAGALIRPGGGGGI